VVKTRQTLEPCGELGDFLQNVQLAISLHQSLHPLDRYGELIEQLQELADFIEGNTRHPITRIGGRHGAAEGAGKYATMTHDWLRHEVRATQRNATGGTRNSICYVAERSIARTV
jgi:hypothetical protein